MLVSGLAALRAAWSLPARAAGSAWRNQEIFLGLFAGDDLAIPAFPPSNCALFSILKFRGLPQKPPLPMSPRSRGVAQPGSAFVWGTKGRRFKSGRSDHSSN